MSTSVHIPPPLLKAVDRHARALKISRNRFVVQALENAVNGDRAWPPGFFDQFRRADPELKAAVDEMYVGIVANRRSKRKAPF